MKRFLQFYLFIFLLIGSVIKKKIYDCVPLESVSTALWCYMECFDFDVQILHETPF